MLLCMLSCTFVAYYYHIIVSQFCHAMLSRNKIYHETSRTVNSKSPVGISSVAGRIWHPVHGKGPTEPIIKESAVRPVTEELPTELF